MREVYRCMRTERPPGERALATGTSALSRHLDVVALGTGPRSGQGGFEFWRVPGDVLGGGAEGCE